VSTRAAPAGGRRRGSERAQEARRVLVELAAELFATHGYMQTSMRDIARQGSVSMATIYAHFKNKVELLVEAINNGIAEELENHQPRQEGGSVQHIEPLSDVASELPRRRRLRALLVQAAAAAQTERKTRARLLGVQQLHVARWVATYEANRERLGIDSGVEMETAVLYAWAAELGLGVLEAFGMEPKSPENWADIQDRVTRSLRLPASSDD
jgi:AcrR family transcriptional regulator